MSIRRNPQKAVPVLLACLQKVKKQVMPTEDADSDKRLSSKFQEIETTLSLMANLLPKIKTWEKTVTEQFCLLELELADDIFKDPEMESEIHDKLALIKNNIDELMTLISKADSGVTKSLRTMSLVPRNMQPVDVFDQRTVSQEWLDLKMEDRIFKSMAMSSLFASFHCLENSRVKMCLLYLSIFPEKSVFKKKPVIYWWIGEGLAKRNMNGTAEEDGEEVFQELLKEGFVRASSKKQKSFIVDPWIRRMLIRLAKERRFLSFNNDWKLCNDRRRAFLWKDNEQISNGDERAEELLTVFNVNKHYLRMRPELLAKLKKVEVLQMGRWQDSDRHHIEVENQMLLNDGLGTQKHLKYLSLRGISRIEILPPSISKLISLEILDLRACHNLESLPPGISALKNLTHLDVSECYLLETMPKGLEHLLKLQVLKGFVVRIAGKNSCKIRDLSRLKSLRKLSIRVSNLEEAGTEDQLESLAIFQALRILTISWGVVSLAPIYLALPLNLKKLDLRCVPFRSVPVWMWPSQLPSLEKLYITGGQLHSLNHYDRKRWKVRILRLKYLKNLKLTRTDLTSLFPEYLFVVKSGCFDPDIELNRELDDLVKAAT